MSLCRGLQNDLIHCVEVIQDTICKVGLLGSATSALLTEVALRDNACGEVNTCDRIVEEEVRVGGNDSVTCLGVIHECLHNLMVRFVGCE